MFSKRLVVIIVVLALLVVAGFMKVNSEPSTVAPNAVIPVTGAQPATVQYYRNHANGEILPERVESMSALYYLNHANGEILPERVESVSTHYYVNHGTGEILLGSIEPAGTFQSVSATSEQNLSSWTQEHPAWRTR